MPEMPLAERTFLSEGSVLVTNARLVSNGQTYAIAGVTSVRTNVEAPSSFGVLCIVVGAIVLLIALLNASGVGTVWGAVILMIGVLIAKAQRATHHLILHSSSGEVRAISSKDGDFIARILAAVNNAIISRS